MRVFLGPNPIAGVLWEYRKGLRRLGIDARVVIREAHPFGYPFDEVYELKGGRIRQTCWELNHLARFLRHFDIFHFVFGASLVHKHRDVPVLKLARKKIVMSFLGSDIRCSTPVLEGKIDRKDCNYCKYPCRLSTKKKMVKFWARNADAIFSGLTNSQLLDFYSIPYHPIVLPIDIKYWKPFESNFYTKEKDETLIVHAPSNMRVKGTSIIVKDIRKLKRKYKINFKLLHDMPNSVVREWLNKADIIIDQFGCGWHGKLSVESMALGKPTLCYINNEYKLRHPQFSNLPIVNITPNNLYEMLESLINDPSLRERIGLASRKYVEKVHDSRIVCKKLLNIYQGLI